MTLRIHVMGGQGSGKTTLARRLGALLAAPMYELDLVGWEEGTGRERTLEEKLARVREIAAQPRWMVEGTMLGWSDPGRSGGSRAGSLQPLRVQGGIGRVRLLHDSAGHAVPAHSGTHGAAEALGVQLGADERGDHVVLGEAGELAHGGGLFGCLAQRQDTNERLPLLVLWRASLNRALRECRTAFGVP